MTSLEDVLKFADYDIRENVEDAKWLLGQINEFQDLCEAAEELVDLHEDYELYVENAEEAGETPVSFEEWRENS